MREIGVIMAELEKKRAVMVEIGMSKGFTDPETVRISQEVDELHNEVMRWELNEANAAKTEIKQKQGAKSA